MTAPSVEPSPKAEDEPELPKATVDEVVPLILDLPEDAAEAREVFSPVAKVYSMFEREEKQSLPEEPKQKLESVYLSIVDLAHEITLIIRKLLLVRLGLSTTVKTDAFCLRLAISSPVPLTPAGLRIDSLCNELTLISLCYMTLRFT